MKLYKPLLFCWFGLSSSFIFAINASIPEYDNIPITPQTWQEVDLRYTKSINGTKCIEQANLLRPQAWIKKNILNRKTASGTVHLSKDIIGIETEAKIIVIKSANIYFDNKVASTTRNRPVIGTFLRCSTNVTDYIFEDTVTHKQEIIQATPEHPFYLIDQHNYVPVGDIKLGKYGKSELLKTITNHNVRLVSKKKHNGKVEAVYNFEVYQVHNYAVGSRQILVHNGCNIPKKKKHQATNDTNDGIGEGAKHFENSQIRYNLLGEEYIEPIDMQPINPNDTDTIFLQTWDTTVGKRLIEPQPYRIKNILSMFKEYYRKFDDWIFDGEFYSGTLPPTTTSPYTRRKIFSFKRHDGSMFKFPKQYDPSYSDYLPNEFRRHVEPTDFFAGALNSIDSPNLENLGSTHTNFPVPHSVLPTEAPNTYFCISCKKYYLSF